MVRILLNDMGQLCEIVPSLVSINNCIGTQPPGLVYVLLVAALCPDDRAGQLCLGHVTGPRA